MSLDLFSASILLILVLDPFGNLPLVVSALAKVQRSWPKVTMARPSSSR